jgi:menaquinone-dependent protoporphyrinogen oxidase
VLAGASIHAGHHQRELLDWAERHRTGLAQLPAAFFSVCLTAADDTDESREATRGYLDNFVERTGWTPSRSTTFAGALQYREYDFVTRLMMRLLMRHMQHRTDASRDYDYTDWDAVDRWAREFAATATEAVAAR